MAQNRLELYNTPCFRCSRRTTHAYRTSISLGVRGAQEHPRVHDAIQRIVDAARAHGKFLGRPAGTVDDMEAYMKQGFRFFQAKSDLGFMTAGAKAFLDRLGKGAAGTPSGSPLY